MTQNHSHQSTKDNDELLTLMRKQEIRAQNREYEAEMLRKWAGGFAGFSIFILIIVFTFAANFGSSSDIETESNGAGGGITLFAWVIIAGLLIAAILWGISKTREP